MVNKPEVLKPGPDKQTVSTEVMDQVKTSMTNFLHSFTSQLEVIESQLFQLPKPIPQSIKTSFDMSSYQLIDVQAFGDQIKGDIEFRWPTLEDLKRLKLEVMPKLKAIRSLQGSSNSLEAI